MNEIGKLLLPDGSQQRARIVGWYGNEDIEFELESGEHAVLSPTPGGRYSIIPLKNGVPDFSVLNLGEDE